MAEHAGEVCRDGERFAVVVNQSVGRLCPFQDDVRPVLAVEGEEATVQFAALLFEHANLHLDTCLPQFADAAALHLGKLVDAAHDDAAHTFLNNQVGTRGRLAVVRTRF